MPGSKNGTIKRVDVHISNSSFDSLCKGALEVLKSVKNWPSDMVKFELFKDGITNHLLKCFLEEDSESAVLVRVYGEKTELFIDRALEVRNMQMMFESRLCAPLYCAFNNGLCYGFSPGEVLDTKSVRDPAISRLIAHKLAKMHSVNVKLNGFTSEPSLFPVLNKYLNLIPIEFEDREKHFWYTMNIPCKDELEAEITLLESHLSNLESPVVFCHNDLLLKNIIYNKEKESVTFIDYEYADYNFQAFDIGNHFCEFAGVETYEPHLYPDKDFQMKWLKHYLEAWYEVNEWNVQDVTNEMVEVLYVQVTKFSLAAHLFWGVWALIQSEHSTLDFDFLRYAKERMDEYFERKEEILALQFPRTFNGDDLNYR